MAIISVTWLQMIRFSKFVLKLLGKLRLENIRHFVTGNAKPLIILGWVALTLIQTLSTLPTVSKASETNIDVSWLMSLSALTGQNYLSGRDFHFTFGPLIQIVSGVAGLFNRSGTAFDDYALVTLAWSMIGIGLVALLVYLIKALNWRYSLFFLFCATLTNLYLQFSAMRPLFAVFCCVLLSFVLRSINPKKRMIGAGLTGFSCFLGQLLSADVGLYSLTGLILVLLAYIIAARFPVILKNKEDLLALKDYASLLGLVIGGFIVGNLLISFYFLISSVNYSGFFDYQKYLLATLQGYNYTMGLNSWGLSIPFSWLLVLVIVGTMFYSLKIWLNLPVREGYLIACLLPLALINLRSAVIRSDSGHIALSLIPFTVLLLVLGLDWSKSGKVNIFWASLLVTFVLIYPATNLQPLSQFSPWMEGKFSITATLNKISNQNTPPTQVVSKELINALDPKTTLVSFPYDNFIPFALNRPFIAPVLQSYAAFNPELQSFYVSQLDRYKNSLEVIYGLDGVNTIRLESVQQISRVPLIFDYLYRNFTPKIQKPIDGYMILKPRPQPLNLKFEKLPFKYEEGSANLKRLNIDQPSNCPVVRLTMKVTYPITSWLGRPTHLNVNVRDMTIPGGKKVTKGALVTIDPGKEFTTYFSMLEGAEFAKVFFDPAKAVSLNWNQISISPTEDAFLDVSPSSIEVNQLECLKLS